MPAAQAAAPPAEAPLVPAILASRCPRCAKAPLFAGWVRFADRCRACGLDFSQFNVGDGPAAFLILIVGGLIVALALTLQLSVEPPFWVHILLWVPLTSLLVVYCLRLSKAALLILEYRNQAREGRIAPERTTAA
ncbi:DUF983 domain-containing protein [Sphingobium sufflavum]|uniref:DUF983 domain-containing protein n=1 Tax=Sphingobium sufflavum TaxID=1129547 RepID=UPI001F31B68A|nr:DUF983 domain-containing protein [Sphingobium sufflavum]